MKVIILRGLPGTGKSTLAKQIPSGVFLGRTAIVSADDYFIDHDTGEYRFNAAKLPEAHEWCLRNFLDWTDHPSGINSLIVDNTNVLRAHYAKYLRIAERAGFETEIRIAPLMPSSVNDMTIGQIKDLAVRNIHGVPASTIASMAAQWED